MITKALQQLLHDVDWTGGVGPASTLDVLVLDLPPGTGDTQLTITQQVVLDGAVLVSTPQQLAISDTMKGLGLFKRVGVNVLGVVQNMSGFRCGGCGEVTYVFGEGGMRREAERAGLEVLADVPLDGAVCRDADRGAPSVVGEPDGAGRIFVETARRIGDLIRL